MRQRSSTAQPRPGGGSTGHHRHLFSRQAYRNGAWPRRCSNRWPHPGFRCLCRNNCPWSQASPSTPSERRSATQGISVGHLLLRVR